MREKIYFLFGQVFFLKEKNDLKFLQCSPIKKVTIATLNIYIYIYIYREREREREREMKRLLDSVFSVFAL